MNKMIKEMRAYSLDEIKIKIQEVRLQLFKIKTRAVEQAHPKQAGNLRNQLARLKTIATEFNKKNEDLHANQT